MSLRMITLIAAWLAVAPFYQTPADPVISDPLVAAVVRGQSVPAGELGPWVKSQQQCQGAVKAAQGLTAKQMQIGDMVVHQAYASAITTFVESSCLLVNRAVAHHKKFGNWTNFADTKDFIDVQAKVESDWQDMFRQMIEICRRNKRFQSLVEWWDLYDKAGKTAPDELRKRAFADMQELRKLVKLPPITF